MQKYGLLEMETIRMLHKLNGFQLIVELMKKTEAFKFVRETERKGEDYTPLPFYSLWPVTAGGSFLMGVHKLF